jgi:aryl-alcohol dehydrogenase-like predicted oxidoreductase
VIAYSPLAQGVLSGRYGPGHAPGGMRGRSRAFAARNLPRVARLGAELRDVGDRHGATPSQVALAWLLRHPNLVAIPGASGERQLEENAAAADLVLPAADVEQIEAAVALYRAP